MRKKPKICRLHSFEKIKKISQLIYVKESQPFKLEGTENRISVERKRFNEVAQSYNTYIRQFPNNILSGMFGFQSKAYFAAESGAEKAPKVEF